MFPADAVSSLMGLVGCITRLISEVIHIYRNFYETCTVRGHESPYDGDINEFVSEPVVPSADWEIELSCPEHGRFSVLAGNLIQPA